MENNIENTGFNYLQFGIKALRYWYLLIIGALFGVGIAFYQVRYSVPVYKVDARIMVKDEYTSWGQEFFLPGMELVSTRNRLVNEIGSIRSFPLMRKVIDELPEFKVFYYGIGNIKVTEMYRNSPFKVSFDTIINSRIYNKTYYLKILSDDNYAVGTKNNGDYDWKEQPFRKPINLKGNILNISLNGPFTTPFDANLYSFVINNPDQLAINYQGGLGISLEKEESSILTVSRTGNSIYKEIDFINKFLDVYIGYGLEKNNQIASNVVSFVEEQIDNILDTLILAENKLERFKSRSNKERISLAGEELVPEITKLEKEKIDIEFNIVYYEQLISYIQENDDASGIIVPNFIDRNSVLFSLLVELINQYSVKLDVQNDLTATNEKWILLNKKIEVSKQILVENIRSALMKTKSDLKRVQEGISFIESKMKSVPNAEREFINIQRDYKLNNDLYTYLLTKKAEASIAKGSNVPNAQVLDWATPYRISFVGPIKSKIYGSNILFGLAISSLIVFLLIYFNDRIINKIDLENATNLPTLAVIGHNDQDNDLVVANTPKSMISESFRGLRTNIKYLVEGKERFCVLVTSSIGSEGKTFCCMNLAHAFSLLGKKTIIVGGDLRKPMIYKDFGLKNDCGLSNYLINKTGIQEIIQTTDFENIDIISAGPIPPNPSELLGNKAMEGLLAELKDMYDIVVIDTPPFGMVSDALNLIKYSDVILYVVRQNVTKRNHLNMINEHFEKGEIKNLGIVI
ncbi:MAG TPA: polysaccharide biosynthesis tyrosine autokinase, partial [Flavobacteriales bacterium]|nr:polysaccharide biosynthesis tyrosine autokinase [Flavobacteriales bacterium]